MPHAHSSSLDIKKFVALRSNNNAEVVEEKKPSKIKNEFEHSDFGQIEIKDIPRVKKLSSKYLTNSWTTIPHVTNHDEADITEMENFRNSLTDIYTGEKIKITPLAFIVKALVASLKKFPSFNSSIDEIETGKMTMKKYYHIGIAVDTPNGLMVPKIRNANNKKISHISRESSMAPSPPRATITSALSSSCCPYFWVRRFKASWASGRFEALKAIQVVIAVVCRGHRTLGQALA